MSDETNAEASVSSRSSGDIDLINALEEAGKEIDQGRTVDVESLVSRFPERGDYLRELIETLLRVRALEHAVEQSGTWPAGRKQIGEFRLLRRIASGGMGTVYEAEQESLDRRVALKVLHFAGLADQRQLTRFKNEARAAATLHHPHIVPVFSVGNEDGLHYFAMQYIDGCTLAEVIACAAKEPADKRATSDAEDAGGDVVEIASSTAETRRRSKQSYIRTVVRWAIEAAEALSFAHHNGVLHRDIKPGNLMVDKEGKLWVADFGLARLNANETLTATGELIGTVRYMSPEQALLKVMPIDHRSDIYSLGITLYELLTLKAAFDGSNRHEILSQMMAAKVTAPRQIEPAISPDLEKIVLKAAAFDAEDRYETADDFAQDLCRLLNNQPVRAKLPSRIDRLSKWMKRHRRIASIAMSMMLLVVLALSASTLVALVSWQRERVATRKAIDNENLTRRQLYLSDVKLASAAIVQHDLIRARRLLDRHIPGPNAVDHRGFVWRHLWDRANPDVLVFREHQARVNAISVLRESDELVSGDEQGRLLVWDRWKGGLKRSIATGLEPIDSVLASRSGDQVFVGVNSGAILSIDPVSGESFELGRVSDASIRTLRLSRDGSRILAGSADGHATLFDAGRGGVLERWINRHGGRCDAYFLPDNRKLYIDDDWYIAVREEDVIKRIRCLGNGDKLSTLAVSDDGGRFAYGSKWGRIGIVDLATGETNWQIDASKHRIESLAFVHGEPWLIAGDKDGGLTLVSTESGQVLAHPGAHAGRVNDLGVIGEERLVVSASDDGTCRVFDLNTLRTGEVLGGDEAGLSAAMSRDGSNLIVCASAQPSRLQRSGLWKVSRGTHLYDVRATFSVDGSIFATYYSPFLGPKPAGRPDSPISRVDIDRDGDLDWLSGIGSHLTLVWQENLGADKRGVIRTVWNDHRYPVMQWIQNVKDEVFDGHATWIGPSGRNQLLRTFDAESLEQSDRGGLLSENFNAILFKDFDGDGSQDLLYRDSERRRLVVHSFKDHTEFETNLPAKEELSIAAFDLDSDGLLDLLLADQNEGTIAWSRQFPTNEFQVPENLMANLVKPQFVKPQDVNGDGQTDLVTSDNGVVVALRRTTDHKFARPATVQMSLDQLCTQHPLPDIAVWSTKTGKQLTSIHTLDDRTLEVAVSWDNQWLVASGSRRRLQIYDLQTGRCANEIIVPDYRIEALAFSPKGDRLAVGHGDSCKLFRTDNWQEMDLSLDHRNTVNQVLWSQSGKILITAGHDLRVMIWDSESGKMLRELAPLDDRPSVLTLSIDESTLLVGTQAGTLSLWDVESGQPLMEQANPGGAILSAGFTEDHLDYILRTKNEVIKRRLLAPKTSRVIAQAF